MFLLYLYKISILLSVLFTGFQMLAIVIAGCAAIFIFFVIIVWHVYSNKRRPQLQSSVVIAEPLQPQVVCRSVPCQHPYYRVISEYTDQDISKERALLNEKVGVHYFIL